MINGITEELIALGTVFILFEDDNIIGFYSFVKDAKQVAWLEHFFIHPNFIGKLYGKKMWDLCLVTANELGLKDFLIWADKHAEGFYLRQGCIKIDEKLSTVVPGLFHPILKYVASD